MFDGASNYADSVDDVMLLIVGISVFLLVGITVTMIYFVFRYSRKRNPVATQIHGNIILEIIWIIIPTIIVMVMFWYGFKGYKDLRAEQDYSMQIDVWAYMWGWDFEYENGKTSDTLFIPVSRITKLEMESRDVNHSLFIPAFRLKEDVMNGRKTYLILTPKKTGVYDIACAEYCGLNHAYMYTKLYVMEDDEFDKWYSGSDADSTDVPDTLTNNSLDMDLSQAGSAEDENTVSDEKTAEEIRKLYQRRITNSPDFQLLGAKGCIACHSTDGSKMIGPSFMELADGKTNIRVNGDVRTVEVNREYLRKAILEPDAEIVDGYRKYMMPTSRGMVNDEELERIIDLLMPEKQ